MELMQQKLDLILQMYANGVGSSKGKEPSNFTPETPLVSGEGAAIAVNPDGMAGTNCSWAADVATDNTASASGFSLYLDLVIVLASGTA